MSTLHNSAATVGLLTTGQQSFVIPTNDIRVKLSEKLPWEDPTGMLTIKRIQFDPHDGVIDLRIFGSLETKPMRIKAVPLPVEIGFVLFATAALRFDAARGALFCEAQTIEIDSLTPLDGLGPLGDVVGEVVPRAYGMAVKGVHKVGEVLPDAPSMPKGVKRIGGRIIPGFAKRIGRAVGGTVASAASGVSDFTAGKASATTAYVKGLVVNGVNAFLSRTPVYFVPDEINGIPIKGAVEDIRVVGNQLHVQLNVTKNPTLKLWWLAAVGGVFALAGIGGYYLF